VLLDGQRSINEDAWGEPIEWGVIDFKEVTAEERPLKMIDSNMAILVPSLWLKVDEKEQSANNLGKTRSKR
jgi:hypothetical protein